MVNTLSRLAQWNDIAAAELIYGGGDYKPDDDEYFFDLDDLNIPDDWGYYARSVLHDTSGYDTVKFIGGEYLGSGVVFNYDPGLQ